MARPLAGVNYQGLDSLSDGVELRLGLGDFFLVLGFQSRAFMFQVARIMLRAGGFAVAFREQVQIGLEHQLIEDHPEDDEEDDLINDAKI